MPPMQVNPAIYDIFRDELDTPEQECTNAIECAVRSILEAIGEDEPAKACSIRPSASPACTKS